MKRRVVAVPMMAISTAIQINCANPTPTAANGASGCRRHANRAAPSGPSPRMQNRDQSWHEVGLEWRTLQRQHGERDDLAPWPEHQGATSCERPNAQKDFEGNSSLREEAQGARFRHGMGGGAGIRVRDANPTGGRFKLTHYRSTAR